MLNVWSASIYIFHNLEKTTNNMGQTFGKKKHSHIPTTREPFILYNIIPK
jgi:hypothetical protein